VAMEEFFYLPHVNMMKHCYYQLSMYF